MSGGVVVFFFTFETVCFSLHQTPDEKEPDPGMNLLQKVCFFLYSKPLF